MGGSRGGRSREDFSEGGRSRGGDSGKPIFWPPAAAEKNRVFEIKTSDFQRENH